MGRTIALATPVFFLMIVLEYAIGRMRGRSNYRVNDAISSLSLGVMSQDVTLFTRLLGLGHESAVFWASHVVHHQSQEYTL